MENRIIVNEMMLDLRREGVIMPDGIINLESLDIFKNCRFDYVSRKEMAQMICDYANKFNRENIEEITEIFEIMDMGIEFRICTKCGNLMMEGVCYEEAGEYYCSDNCLYQEVTKEQYEEHYKDDIAYYTEWV